MNLPTKKGTTGLTRLSSLLEMYKTVKVRRANTLFPVTYSWPLLLNSLCPACGRKLKLLQRKPLLICGRKTCPATQDKDPFKISISKLNEIMAKNKELLGYREKKLELSTVK